MSSRRAVLVIAGVVLLVGLVFAFAPVTTGGISCGNAFASSTSEAAGADLFETGSDYVGACEDALTSRRWIAFGLMGLAGLVLLFGLLTSTGVASSAEQNRPARQ